jgi:hypothetical protein
VSETSDKIFDGIRAAALLEEACRTSPPDAARIEVVRELALDLRRQLEALSELEDATPDVLAEAAICCADLANLAACNAPDLLPESVPRATEAALLAARAVESLGPLVEARSEILSEDHAENLLRDVRSAVWRAGFAADLVEPST